jgi:hypothetical protein
MVRYTPIAFVLSFAVFGWFRASAQEIGFKATVDRTSIAAGEQLKLTVNLSNSRESFEAPSFGGLVVVQGPFENSSFNYVNGRMSSSLGRTWVLTSTKPGTYTIGAAKVRIGGGVVQTEPITIEVTKGSAPPSDAASRQGQDRDANLFATISLSKDQAFVGEQVIATYTLFSRYNSIELSKYELPKMDGYWAEEIDLGNTGWEDGLRTVNGIQYRVAILKKQVLFPQRSGQLSIAPMELTCVVNRSFFNRGSSINIRSNSATLTARPLPTNAPPDFRGAVGDLTMSVTTDRTQVKANEAIELTLTFSGKGNLRLLDTPNLDFPNDFESYDPKVTDKISVNSGGMSGSRSYQYLLIPRHEGAFPLDPITFTYFDTRSGSYRTITAPPMQVEVSAGDGSMAATIQRPNKTEVEVLGKDIRYIRTGDLELQPKGEHLFGSPAWIAGMSTPALALVLFAAWRRKRARDEQDVSGMRRKQADKVAKKRLTEAAKALQGNDRSAFYTALGKALHGYLSDKFTLGHAETTAVRIRACFSPFENGAPVAEEYILLMEAADMARYAPVEDRPRQQLYDEAASLIGRTEQLVRA